MGIRIALAGNPNSGKTTLFNALTGSNQFVGNWPGVTVEKKEGKLKKHDDVIITDLPGIYSLSPYTLEEVVARNYLIGLQADGTGVPCAGRHNHSSATGFRTGIDGFVDGLLVLRRRVGQFRSVFGDRKVTVWKGQLTDAFF